MRWIGKLLRCDFFYTHTCTQLTLKALLKILKTTNTEEEKIALNCCAAQYMRKRTFVAETAIWAKKNWRKFGLKWPKMA